MHEISDDWIRLVEAALIKMELMPPLEEHFPFPWGDASQAIGSALQIGEFHLAPTRAAWREHQEILQGVGDEPCLVTVELSPIEGGLFFALSKQDVAHLASEAVSEHKEGFSNAKLQEGFYHFLFLKALQAIDHLKIFKEVSFHFSPTSRLPQESGFCVDIDCGFSGKTLKGRLICPQSFLASFKAHQPMQKNSLLSANNVDISLRSEIGSTSITAEEWENVNVGDFVMLDRCSYDPVEGKGSTTLMLGDTPLLMARMKPEGMKILDFAFYQEEMPPVVDTNYTLTAEIGHIVIPLQKLLHLQPGNMLDLIQRPELGIDITISGKKAGKGELLKLGETLGLRIIER